jgi:hypothetical protein
MPAEWMWPFPDATNEWFEEVRARKGLDDDPNDTRTKVPMTKNEDPRLLALRGR